MAEDSKYMALRGSGWLLNPGPRRRFLACAITIGLALLIVGNSNQMRADEKQSRVETLGPVEVPEPSTKALEYYKTGTVLWWISLIWQLAILCLFVFTGLSARTRQVAERIGRKWFFTFVIYFLFFSTIDYLLYLPLGYYQGFIRPHSYGLSDQAFSKWLGDSLKGLIVGVAFGVLFLWVPYLLMKKSPRRWWLYTGILAVPVIFFLVLIEPIWVEPLFNDFGEMKNKQLEAKILALADRAGIDGARVFEVNKSTDTKTVNAYVTGLGSTKRIVLWDTLLDKLDEKEILFVMGHEMGHYVLNHVLQGILFAVAIVFFGLYLIHRITQIIISHWHTRLGFDQVGDIASWPLVLLVGNVLYLLAAPGVMAFSRHLEHEADRFGLEITQDNHAAAMGFVKLLDNNLGNPRPGLLYKIWRASHPTPAERIEFCNQYRPWEHGQQLRYGDRFRSTDP
jgi:Zn-dependent protease with chaperone function